jgi:hypothetical protein
MVIQVKPPSKRRIGRAIEALFREARLLERRRRRRYAALALLTSAALATVAYLIADTRGGSPATSTHDPTQALATRRCVTEPTVRVSPRLSAHFAVFRRLPPDGVSAPSADTVANPQVLAFLQLNLACTQLVRTPSGPVWIVPGRRGACVMSGQVSTTIAPRPGQNRVGCTGTDGILQNGAVVEGGQRNGPDVVFGLVPDGNTSVTLTFAKGAPRRVPLVNHVLRTTIPAGRVTVAFRNAAGAPVSHRYPG